MSSDSARKELTAWLGASRSRREMAPGRAPEEGGAVTSPARAEAEVLVQLNFKIPSSLKRRIKLLAARDSISLLTLLNRMLTLYEGKHGRIDV